jgi:hypothetical protein
MKTLNITLPETLEVGGPAGHERSMPTANWTEEFILNMMLHGIKQRRTDRFSVVKSNEGVAKATVALGVLDANLIAGELPSSGTRGPSLSIETAAWLAYFKSKGCTIKLVDLDAGKRLVPSSDNLDQFQTAYVKEAIWPSVAKCMIPMSHEDREAFRKDKLPGIIEQHKERVIGLAESDKKAVKPFIDAEKLKRGTKTDDSFHVEIEISL